MADDTSSAQQGADNAARKVITSDPIEEATDNPVAPQGATGYPTDPHIADMQRQSIDGHQIDPHNGPISRIWDNKVYLEKHHIPEVFESLMSALMLEKPEDHFAFLDNKLQIIREVGVHNVNWETFVYDLHQLRDPLRMKLLGQDGEDANKLAQDAFIDSLPDNDGTSPVPEDEKYTAELFHLTEAQGQ